MQARLKVLHDKANVKQVKLLPVTLIGRSTECNLKIASSQVSRNHCRITVGQDTVFVEDLGSANGTLVDGQPIPPHQAVAIAPGARLIVGPAEFLIDYVATTSATIVLPRTGVPPQPELPSTEMIFPVVSTASPETVQQPPIPAAVAAAPVEVPAAVPVALASAAVAPMVPALALVPDSTSVAGTVTTSEGVQEAYAQFPPTQNDSELTIQEMASPIASPAEETFEFPQPRASDTVVLEPETVFGFTETASTTTAADPPTEFLFGVATSDFAPAGESAPAPEPPKKGLKSLFSLFGRKDKSGSSKHQATVQDANPTTAGVFLPTVDATPENSVSGDDAFVVGISDEQADADVPATIPADPELADVESTEEDDGFQNFLSNL